MKRANLSVFVSRRGGWPWASDIGRGLAVPAPRTRHATPRGSRVFGRASLGAGGRAEKEPAPAGVRDRTPAGNLFLNPPAGQGASRLRARDRVACKMDPRTPAIAEAKNTRS